MSETNDDSRLSEIKRDDKIHESCPPRYNKNFISDLEKKLKAMELQARGNLRLPPDLPPRDRPLNLEQDPKKIAESSKFKFNIQEIAAPDPGLRGLECSFKVNLNHHPGSTPPEKPDQLEAFRWQGVLTFRDAENPHHDLEEPSMDQGSRAARGLPLPSPEFVDDRSGLAEINMSWTKQILKSLRVHDEVLGLQANRWYIPCIDIAYWGVFCFRMYGTPFWVPDMSIGLAAEPFKFKDPAERQTNLLLHVILNQPRIKQARYDMQNPDERLRTRREVHEDNCSRCGSLLTSFSVDGPGPSNTPKKWDGTHLDEGHLKTFPSYHGSESSSSGTSEEEPVKVVDYSSPWPHWWFETIEPLSNPTSPFTRPSDIPDSSEDSQ